VPRFVLVIVAAYLANIATMYVALGLAINGYIAHATDIIPDTVVSHLGAAFFVFRNPDPRTAQRRTVLKGGD
jgi:hypothetical protein